AAAVGRAAVPPGAAVGARPPGPAAARIERGTAAWFLAIPEHVAVAEPVQRESEVISALECVAVPVLSRIRAGDSGTRPERHGQGGRERGEQSFTHAIPPIAS